MGGYTIELIGVISAALITSLIGPVVIEYVKKKFNKENKMGDPVKKELVQSTIITDELEDVRELLDSDRAWITIIHNGGHFLHSNKSIQKFSIMHEVSKPGVSSIGMILKNIPISLFTRSVEQQVKGDHIYIKNIDDPKIPTFGLKPGFESTGTKSSLSKGLFDISSGSLIGTIGVDFLTPTDLTEEEIDIFKGRAERMSGYISNFINDV